MVVSSTLKQVCVMTQGIFNQDIECLCHNLENDFQSNRGSIRQLLYCPSHTSGEIKVMRGAT